MKPSKIRPYIFFFLGCVAASSEHYIFDRAICTGLGDRLGTMLSLATLARIENSTVSYLWCNDPVDVLPRIRKHIPSWIGYTYPLAELKTRFVLPKEIILVSDLSSPDLQKLPKVQWGPPTMSIPAEQGADSIPGIAWQTMRLSLPAHSNVFQKTYKAIASSIRRVLSPYAVLHIRAPDMNTFVDPSDTLDNYCTGNIIKRMLLLLRGPHYLSSAMNIYVISNNVTWADQILGGRMKAMDESASELDHFELLLSASAIIQHAWQGWSAFSSVAALISEAPLINTYKISLPNHRYHFYRTLTGLPSNYYDCTQQLHFMRAILGE